MISKTKSHSCVQFVVTGGLYAPQCLVPLCCEDSTKLIVTGPVEVFQIITLIRSRQATHATESLLSWNAVVMFSLKNTGTTDDELIEAEVEDLLRHSIAVADHMNLNIRDRGAAHSANLLKVY